MARQGESVNSRDLVDALTMLGLFAYKTFGSSITRSGIPDIIACSKGRFIGIESKMANEKLTAKQEYNLTLLEKNGGVALVCRFYRGDSFRVVVESRTGQFHFETDSAVRAARLIQKLF